MSLLSESAESVLLGETILSVREGYLWGVLEALDPKDYEARWLVLSDDERKAIEERARGFTSDLVRHLSERHEGDERALSALLAWGERNKDYEVFDALLCHFEFPNRERVLDEGQRLFPSTLTSHWVDD